MNGSRSRTNAMSEACVNTLRRDYVAGADPSTGAVLLDQAPARLAHYHAVAPHSALGFKAPRQYRAAAVKVSPIG
jgi:putative transposase